jgi:hypothetical protein
MKKLLFYCVVLLGLGSCGQGFLSYELGSEKASLKVARRNTSIFLETSLDTSYSSTMRWFNKSGHKKRVNLCNYERIKRKKRISSLRCRV